MPRLPWLLATLPLALSTVAAFGACSSNNNGTTTTGSGGSIGCMPGSVFQCTCTGTDVGTQTCQSDHTYSICNCQSGAGGTGGSATTSTGTGGTGSVDAGDAGGDAEAGPPPGTPVALVQGLSGVQDLAVKTGNVFWTAADTGGTVAQCAITGCAAPSLLATAQGFPRGIAATSGTVLWSVYQGGITPDAGIDPGFIGRATAGGVGSGKPYLPMQDHPDAIAADPNNVYWSVVNGIHQCDLFGCTTTPITLAAVTAQAIAVDASFVYWTEAANGRVSRVPIGGGVPPTSISFTDVLTTRGLAVTDTDVFWASTTEVFRCPIAGCAFPTTFATQQNIVALRHPLASDGLNVYWSTDKSIVRCPVAGCPAAGPQTVAAGQSEPTSVAVDTAAAGYVYWADGDTIKRVAKPQ